MPSSSEPAFPAQEVRVMHFADAHLGVESYGKYNPETGLNTRLEDFTLALHQAVDCALEADAHIAVFAGDAYKARDPNQTHQRAFAHCLKRLTDAGRAGRDARRQPRYSEHKGPRPTPSKSTGYWAGRSYAKALLRVSPSSPNRKPWK